WTGGVQRGRRGGANYAARAGAVILLYGRVAGGRAAGRATGFRGSWIMRVCSRCHEPTRHFLCPRCGVPTNARERAARPVVRPAYEAPEGFSVWAGVFVGLLLCQGLYYALRHLVNAALLASGGPVAEAEFWTGPDGLIVQQSLQVGGLIVGG